MGFVRARTLARPEIDRTSSSQLRGTVARRPHEIWLSQPYDAACDMWSLGCVVYEVRWQEEEEDAIFFRMWQRTAITSG